MWKALIFVRCLTKRSLSLRSLPFGSSVTFYHLDNEYIFTVITTFHMTPATSLLFVFYFLLFSSLYFPYFFLSSPDFVSLFLLLSLLLHLLFYSSFPSSSLTLLLHTFCVVVNIVNFLRRMVGPPVFNSIKLRLMKSINNSEICRFLSYVIISFLFLDRMSYIECLKSCSSQCGLLWTVTTGEDLWLTTWSLTLWQLRCVNKNKKEVNEWTNFPKLESRTRGWW